MRKVTPLDGYVLVKPIRLEEPKEGIIPVQAPKNRAEVIAVCENIYVFNEARVPALVTGDVVYVKDYVDKPIEDGEDKHFFVQYEDILGKEDK